MPLSRRRLAILSAPLVPLPTLAEMPSTTEVLPSWVPRKRGQFVDFVKATTDPSSPNFVPPEARIATFDQDGTLWVEHPMYSQVVYCLDRVPALVKAKPELANVEPFKTVLSGDREAIAKLSTPDSKRSSVATLTGMTVDTFQQVRSGPTGQGRRAGSARIPSSPISRCRKC